MIGSPSFKGQHQQVCEEGLVAAVVTTPMVDLFGRPL